VIKNIKTMNKILLHICCGICSSAAIQKLQEDSFEVIGLFYNPNIAPEEEYRQRLKVAKDVADIFKIKLIEAPYTVENWFAQTKGKEYELEGGKRCEVCYRIRMEYTSRKAGELGIEFFTTTLTISPHKDTKLINRIGKSINAAGFKEYDFKKEEGFKKAIEFAKGHQLYRQNYCGCVYSQKKA
jgi:predicted adenine nucleotide alpha hydrolase (AANH) superfamily ATPase